MSRMLLSWSLASPFSRSWMWSVCLCLCITLQQIMDVFSRCLPLGGFLLFALAGINCIKMPAVDKIDEAALLKVVDAIIFLLWYLYTPSKKYTTTSGVKYWLYRRYTTTTNKKYTGDKCWLYLEVPKQEAYHDDQLIIFFITIIISPCSYHPDLILLSFIIQDEKNQLLTTNLWLNLVSFPFSKIWRFPGVLTIFFQGWLFITRLSSRGGYITRICSLFRGGYFTGISSRGGYFTRIFSRGGYLSQRVVSDSHIRGIFPPGVVISQEFLLGWLYHKDFFPGVDFFSVHSHKIYPLTWCLFWNWLNKTIIWWWEADILIKLCGWIWWFFICKMYFAWPCESSRNDTHPIPSRL